MGEEHQWFRRGRGMMDGMFMLRQLMEKRLDMQGEMVFGFVDLEKAYDTVPRDCDGVRWMRVLEAEVKLLEGFDDGAKGRVWVDPWTSAKFSVSIGLRQGSSLGPLTFIMVTELISRRVNEKGILGKDVCGRCGCCCVE